MQQTYTRNARGVVRRITLSAAATAVTTAALLVPAAGPAAAGAKEFPSAETTGVPEGTALTSSGSITVTTDGAVIDAKLVNGSITVRADNVTIKRSRIRGSARYPVLLERGYKNLLVKDSEIFGGGAGGAAVAWSDYTLRQVHIRAVAEGPRVGSKTRIEDSYIHGLAVCSGCHSDVLQSTGGTGIVIRGNNLQAFNRRTGKQANAAFQYGEEFSVVRDCLVEGNLVNGGNYSINGGGGGTRGAQCTFRGNHFQRDFRYKPAGNLGPATVWGAGNVRHHNGQPVAASSY